ncbi:MAG TPA: hypothetical protein VEJ20_06390 [Candidatus Eremiobacteraceae bacterium]|nr:hypothetical protein [Candidatus Eremiobacteraceae bacterium]
MNKLLIAGAATIAAAMATTMPAFAFERGQGASDANLRYTRAYVERAVDMLNHDQEDYGGHRADAIVDIDAARTDLADALRFDPCGFDAVLPNLGADRFFDANGDWERDQFASNENMLYTRQYLDRAIAMLNNDQRDYGGYRDAAVDELQAARAQLLDGIRYR